MDDDVAGTIREALKRGMGFDKLKCTYYSAFGAFDNATAFSWVRRCRLTLSNPR
jgi:hypothetical protein